MAVMILPSRFIRFAAQTVALLCRLCLGAARLTLCFLFRSTRFAQHVVELFLGAARLALDCLFRFTKLAAQRCAQAYLGAVGSAPWARPPLRKLKTRRYHPRQARAVVTNSDGQALPLVPGGEGAGELDEPHGGEDCSICLVELVAGDRVADLRCGHEFHIGCLKRWIRHKNKCPLCRAKLVRRARR
jgi:hypothetical protein